MFERILIATDGSDTALRATNQASDVARQYGAELHAVYVIETRTAYDNAIVDPETVRQNLRDEGEEALTRIQRESEPGVSVVTSIETGIPHEELLAYVDEQGIDLVVVGSKGKSDFKTILLGSTTEAIVRADMVPVLVVDSND